MLSYYWKSLACELCHAEYPKTVAHKGAKLSLMEIQKPDYPYIILESHVQEATSRTGVYIISMANKNNIRLGRGHDSDIRISDISVSRFHAMIRFENNEFYLQDNTSKFGTLVAAKDEIELDGEGDVVL